jgi:hypothetical protein
VFFFYLRAAPRFLRIHYERLQAEAKQRWETEKRAYDERRGIVAPTKPASRKTVAATIEEPVPHAAVGSPFPSGGAARVAKCVLGGQSSAKNPGSK